MIYGWRNCSTQMMKTIAKEYSRQGKTGTWRKVQQNAAKIQKDRDFDIVAANKRKIIQDRKDADFYLAVKLMVGLVILMAALAGLVFTLAVN